MEDRKALTVSIMPSYYCNNNCNYCYLPNNMRKDKKLLETHHLSRRLSEIKNYYRISHAEIYGGDIELLPPEYTASIYRTCWWQNVDLIYFIGRPNFPDGSFPKLNISVSINPERCDFQKNLSYLQMHPYDGAIVVITPIVLKIPAKEIFEWFDKINFNGSITFIPLSYGRNNCTKRVSNKEYADKIIELLMVYQARGKSDYTITNLYQALSSIKGENIPDMENNIFITPNGNYACVAFNEDGTEYFKEFYHLAQWREECEKERTERLEYCGHCEYFNNCLAEHFKKCEIKKSGDTCNGYPAIIDYVNRMFIWRPVDWGEIWI